MTASWRPVAARAASLLLRYPDDQVLAAMPIVAAALDELPGPIADPLRTVVDHRLAASAGEIAAEYVELFDFRRRCCLHLTYYTCGDTRKRGEALVQFVAAYKAAGLEVVDGELPDHLPAVLDLAAHDGASGSGGGWALLRANRVGIDLLEKALDKEKSVYRHAVAAVRAMLPPPRPADLVAVADLAQSGPPVEQVGLEPYGFVASSFPAERLSERSLT